MDQRIIDLYDDFTHGGMNRRAFLDRLAEIAGSGAAALVLLPLLQNDYARAATVAADDPRLAIDTVSYDAQGTRISGYLARFKSKGRRPAVIVIHENRGLNPYIEDVVWSLRRCRFDRAILPIAWRADEKTRRTASCARPSRCRESRPAPGPGPF